MKECGIINTLSEANMDKCEICDETKITKKSCKSITRESELLGLIHSDLGDLKHTMTRCGKRFYVIFVDDYSRYTKLYLLRTKDEAFEMFIKHKIEVEDQKNSRIKRLRTDRGGENESNPFKEFWEQNDIIHEVIVRCRVGHLFFFKGSFVFSNLFRVRNRGTRSRKEPSI